MDAALRPLAIVEARGGPRERGLMIGRALAQPIAGHVAALKGALPAWVQPADDYLRRCWPRPTSSAPSASTRPT